MVSNEKKELVKTWEECFGMKIEDKLNEEGLKKLYSEDTSIVEAVDLLTCAGIDCLVESFLDDVEYCIDRFAAKPKKKEERKRDDCKFRVIIDGKIDEHKFNSAREAEEFIENVARTTKYTINDMHVVQEM